MAEHNRYDRGDRRTGGREDDRSFFEEMRDDVRDWFQGDDEGSRHDRERLERDRRDREWISARDRDRNYGRGQSVQNWNRDRDQNWEQGQRWTHDRNWDEDRDWDRSRDWDRTRMWRSEDDQDRGRGDYERQRRNFNRKYDEVDRQRSELDRQRMDLAEDRYDDRSRHQDRDRYQNRGRYQDRDRDFGRGSFGESYGENYSRGWGRGSQFDRGWDQDRQLDRGRDRDFDRSRDQDYRRGGQFSDRGQQGGRYSQDYGRGYNRGNLERDNQNYDYDFDTGYDQRFRRDDDDRDWNQGLGQNYRRDRTYGLGRDPERQWGQQDREQGRGRHGGQQPTGGMRSDYREEQRGYGMQRTGGMQSDFRGQGYQQRDWQQDDDYEMQGDYVGYDSEGAFYQDLDEPYSYEYWEVWMVPGEFTGMGPQGYQRSDERIHEEVCERLTHHGRIDASQIDLQVQDGEVTLSGTVEHREMKRLAEDAIENIYGITNIQNNIKVRKQHDQQDDQQRQRHDQQREQGSATGTSQTAQAGSTASATQRKQDKATTRAGEQGKGHQLREGMEVVGKNGKVVGKVKEIRNKDFLVDRDMARDIYVPFDAVRSVGQQAMLNVSDDDVDKQDWEKPDVV
jgi:hypothetical protein